VKRLQLRLADHQIHAKNCSTTERKSLERSLRICAAVLKFLFSL
jgi:hypothetical protein